MANKKPKKHDERAAHASRQNASEDWPAGVPYTVYFPEGKDYRGADLEHAAPLPRVGDRVDYIDERGASHQYRVHEVVHTLQTSAATRPSVQEGTATPNALARTDDTPAEAPGGGGTLRSGLPEVFLAPIEVNARAPAKPRSRKR